MGSNSKIMKQRVFGSCALHLSTMRSIHLWSFKTVAWIVLDLYSRQENVNGWADRQTKWQLVAPPLASIKNKFTRYFN